MSVAKICCEFCGQLISKSNIKKHLIRHELNPESFNEKLYKLNHDGLECQFCGKICKNRNSLCNHERLCKLNPNRQLDGSGLIKYNQEVRAGMKEVWNKGLIKETSQSVLAQSLSQKNTKKAQMKVFRPHTEAEKEKLRVAAIRNNLGGCYIGNKYKWGYYRGIRCDSSWELAFLVFNLENNINIQRCTEHFFYVDSENKSRKYTPDFLLDDIYIEIKGWLNETALLKINQFPQGKKLKLLCYNELKDSINYCKEKYGNMFWEILYDKDKPSCLKNLKN